MFLQRCSRSPKFAERESRALRSTGRKPVVKRLFRFLGVEPLEDRTLLAGHTLATALPIDDVFVCYHDDADGCSCRKPRPGLLFQAANKHGLDLSLCYVIGDRWRDIDAGIAAGCRTVLIDYGYKERAPSRPPDFQAASLLEAVGWIETKERECTSEISV